MQWQSSLLKKAGVIHGSTDNSFGVLRPEWSDESKAHTNREFLRAKLGLSSHTFVLSQQVHGNDVLVVDDQQAKESFVQLGAADALVTNKPNITIVVKTADCTPVFFYDPKNNAGGVAHSGWKGTIANVVSKTIETMQKSYGTKAGDLFVAIGPAVCPNHYDVSQTTDGRIETFVQVFGDDAGVVVRTGDKTALDLPRACRLQCIEAGVKAKNIELSGICTFEDSRWPSYRREGEALEHDIWSYIAVPTNR